ncbi:MAG: hypothetical protein AAGA25_15565 [Planctomycetota bacterium]
MIHFRSIALPLVLVTTLLPSVTLAQPGASSEAARQRDTLPDPFLRARAADEEDSDTTDDLMLLVEHDLFFAGLTTAVEITDNAFRNNSEENDVIGLAQFIFGAQTVVADKVDASALISVGGARYQDFDELDSDFFTAGLQAAVPFDGFRLGGVLAYDDFNARGTGSDDLSQTRLGIFADKYWTLDNGVSLFALAQLEQVAADPSDYELTRAQIRFGGSYAFTDRFTLNAGLSGKYETYDDYFEDFFNDSRDDFSLSTYLSARYLIHPNVEARVDLHYIHNESSLDDFDYGSTSLTPSITVAARF